MSMVKHFTSSKPSANKYVLSLFVNTRESKQCQSNHQQVIFVSLDHKSMINQVISSYWLLICGYLTIIAMLTTPLWLLKCGYLQYWLLNCGQYCFKIVARNHS